MNMDEVRKAQELLSLGMPIERVAAETGLTREQVESLFLSSQLQNIERPLEVGRPPETVGMSSSLLDSSQQDFNIAQGGLGSVENLPFDLENINPDLIEIPQEQLEQANPDVAPIVSGILAGGDEDSAIGQGVQKEIKELSEKASEEDEALLNAADNQINQGAAENDAELLQGGINFADLVLAANKLDDEQKIAAYRSAVDSLYENNPEYAEAVSPDQALPRQLFGLAMIEAGLRGESPARGFAKGVSAYIRGEIQNRQEVKASKKEIAKQKQQLVSSLYLADVNNQLALAKELQSGDKELYVATVDGKPQTMWFNKAEFNAYVNSSKNPIRKYRPESDEKIQNFSFLDEKGDIVVKGMTQTEAQNYAKDNEFEIRQGNLYDKQKLYLVTRDGSTQTELLTPEQFRELKNSGVDVREKSSIKEAIDTNTGKLVFVESDKLMGDQSRYLPVDDSFSITIGADGQTIVSQGGSQSAAEQRKKRLTEITAPLYKNSRNVLNLLDRIYKVIDEDNPEQPILGTTGQFIGLAKRISNEANNLVQTFGTGNYDFEIDGKKVDYKEFENYVKKEYSDLFNNQGFFGRAQATGLGRQKLQNLQFQLALAFAMVKGQKGRDISDKDLAFHLRNVGQSASSTTDLRAILGELEVSLLDEVESTIGNLPYSDDAFPVYENGKQVYLVDEYVLPRFEQFKRENNFEGRRERLSGVSPYADYNPDQDITISIGGDDFQILPNGNELSGFGNQTIHQLFVSNFGSAVAKNDQQAIIKGLADLLNSLGPDGKNSPEYQNISNYVKQQLSMVGDKK